MIVTVEVPTEVAIAGPPIRRSPGRDAACQTDAVEVSSEPDRPPDRIRASHPLTYTIPTGQIDKIGKPVGAPCCGLLRAQAPREIAVPEEPLVVVIPPPNLKAKRNRIEVKKGPFGVSFLRKAMREIQQVVHVLASSFSALLNDGVQLNPTSCLCTAYARPSSCCCRSNYHVTVYLELSRSFLADLS
jgi:hypothetical protein